MKLGGLLSSLDRPEQETLMFMEVEMFSFNSNVTTEVEFVKFLKFVKFVKFVKPLECVEKLLRAV